jgi:hypothetical protein
LVEIRSRPAGKRPSKRPESLAVPRREVRYRLRPPSAAEAPAGLSTTRQATPNAGVA